MRKVYADNHLIRGVVILLFFYIVAPSTLAHAGDSPPDPLINNVSFDQRVNVQLPLEEQFTDESGNQVHLSQYFGKKPVILQFAYYHCPMLCSLVFNDLAKTVRSMNLKLGDQYEIVTISMDPKETPQLAATKKAAFLSDNDLTQFQNNWHFLTGSQASIDNLTQTAGFHYQYDAQNDEFAHPTGIILITPQGKISRYYFGIKFSAPDLRLGLVEASQGKIGTPVDQFFLLCYHFNPITGKYSLLIDNVLKIAGIATVLLLAGLLLLLIRSERPRPGIT